MKRLFEFIVNHSKLIIFIFIIFSGLCAVCKPMVSVNYDMTDYLPQDSLSTVALDKMNDEFSEGIAGARVMVKNVTVAEALSYKEKLTVSQM